MISTYVFAETDSTDEQAADWTYAGKVRVYIDERPPDVRDIPGWTTTVTRAEAQAEPGLESKDPGLWDGTDEPLIRRAGRVAQSRLADLFVAALAAQV